MPSQRSGEHSLDNLAVDYDLSDSLVRELSKALIDELGRIPDSQFVCFELTGSMAYANVGRTLERQVFEERFGNDVAVMIREYGPYESASTFFMVVDQETCAPVGVLRIIKPSDAGLKTLNDIAGPPLRIPVDQFCNHYGAQVASCWDDGTLAVASQYRGAATRYLASALLYRGLYASAAALGVEYLVAIVDQRAHRGLDLLGIPFKPILNSQPFSYLDSEESTALVGFVPGMPEVMISYLAQLNAARKTSDSDALATLAGIVEGLIYGTGLDWMIQYASSDESGIV